jgi:hypothetical protein
VGALSFPVGVGDGSGGEALDDFDLSFLSGGALMHFHIEAE